MNPSPTPIAAIDASAVTPPSAFDRDRHEPRRRAAGRRFMAPVDIGLAGLLILLGTATLATLAFFVVALMLTGAIEAARWTLGAGAHPPAQWLSLLEFSAIGGGVLACAACAAFVVDLRRQRWL